MDLHTYTDLWRQQRRIHAIQDIPLPAPVPATQLGVAVVAALVWIPTLAWLGVPEAIAEALTTYTSGVNAVLLAGPPIAVAWLVGRPLRHHQTAWQLAASALHYVLSPPRLHRLGELREPGATELAATVWLARPPNAPPAPLRRLQRLRARARISWATPQAALGVQPIRLSPSREEQP